MVVRLADERDREAWNRVVADAPQGDYRQLYEWGDIRSLTGWEPVRLLVEGEGVHGVLQMLSIRAPGTGLRLFYAPRGPAFAGTVEASTFHAMLDGAANQAAAQGGVLLRLDPEPGLWDGPLEQWLAECGFRRLTADWSYWNYSTYTLRLDIRPPADELLASFRKSKRYDIRSAERAGVQVAMSRSREDVHVLYDLVQAAGERVGFAVRGLDYFEACWDGLVARDLGHIFVARYGGVPVAAMLVVHSGLRAWAVHGAADLSMRSVYPYEALHWGMIRSLQERGVHWLDLGPCTGARPGEPGDTLYSFKMGFRPEVIRFPGYYDRPLRPLLYRAWRVTEERVLPWAERVLRKCKSVVCGRPERRSTTNAGADSGVRRPAGHIRTRIQVGE
jgi:lipid II:glycine glycyltransferase (peptidoglycan interpeptide bridge formation enzyme)